jgi:hypothetical protein
MNQEIKEALQEFVNAFECVFHGDWEYTLNFLENIKEYNFGIGDGSFIHPERGDLDPNNWCNIQSLLPAYRNLLKVTGVKVYSDE